MPTDSRLLANTELAERYGVARPTVNNAVSILRAEGPACASSAGGGTIVRDIRNIHRNAMARYQKAALECSGGRGAFDTEIRALGMTPQTNTEVERWTPPPEVARQLGLAEGEPNVIVRRRRMYANDVPVQLAPSYMPGGTSPRAPPWPRSIRPRRDHQPVR